MARADAAAGEEGSEEGGEDEAGFFQRVRETISSALSTEGGGKQDGYEKFQIENITPNLVVIPQTDDITETDVRYPLIKPFADAHIYWDDAQEELVYEVDEPTLTEREQEIFDQIRDALEEKITVPLSELETAEDLIDYLKDEVIDVVRELGYHLDEEEKNKLMYYVYRNFAGLNELEPLMHDPYIEDIGCSGIDIPVYVVHSKFGSIKTDLVFQEEDNLKNLVVKLAERANKYVSYAEPLLDGTLPDGSRVNASLTPDVTTKGPTISIRKFQEVPFSAVDLLDLGTADSEIMAYMWMALQYWKSGLVIGGTATGKTTFLNAVVTFIPPEQKIVSIEDTRELQLPHENWIPSVTRTAAGVKTSEQDITMYQLLRESFRQNPDYVVVGEVRGEEASVLFQGMASGHPSLSTMHASSPSDVISRLTTPPIDLSPALVSTLDLIVAMTHAQELGKNARRVKAIYEIQDISDEGSARTNEWASWTPVDDSFSTKEDSTMLSDISQQFGLTSDEIQQELEDRQEVLEWMHDEGYGHFSEVAKVVSEYYKDKDMVMSAVRGEGDVDFEDLVGEVDTGEEAAAPGEEVPAEEEVRAAGEGDEMQQPAGQEAGGPAQGEEPAAGSSTPRRPHGTQEEADVDYMDAVQADIPEVRERVDSGELDPRRTLQAEKATNNRTTLVQWLRMRVEEAKEQEERADAEQREEAQQRGEDLFGDATVEEDPFE